MGYGLAALGTGIGGLAQGYEQGRAQAWTQKLQQVQMLQQQSEDNMRTWQTLPEGPTKDLAFQAWMQAKDQQSKLIADKGPGSWNTVKHVFGMLPGLNKIIPGQTNTPGGGQVKPNDVQQPSSVPGPPMQTPEIPGAAAVPGTPTQQASQVFPAFAQGETGVKMGTPPDQQRPLPGTPAGTGSYQQMPIQRIPQEALQATGTEPNYGQQPLSIFQRAALNPPHRDPSQAFGTIETALRSGGSIDDYKNDPAKMADLVAGYGQAAKLGYGQEYGSIMSMVLTPHESMVPVQPGTQMGNILGVTDKTRFFPPSVIAAMAPHIAPAEQLKNAAASAELKLTSWHRDHPNQDPPQAVLEDAQNLRWATSPERGIAQAIAASSPTPESFTKNWNTYQDAQMNREIQLYGKRIAEQLPHQQLVPDETGLLNIVNLRTGQSTPVMGADGKPMRGLPRGNNLLPFTKDGKTGAYSHPNVDYWREQLRQNPDAATEQVKSLMAQIGPTKTTPMPSVIPGQPPTMITVPNPDYQAMMQMLAAEGIDINLGQTRPGAPGSPGAITPPPGLTNPYRRTR